LFGLFLTLIVGVAFAASKLPPQLDPLYIYPYTTNNNAGLAAAFTNTSGYTLAKGTGTCSPASSGTKVIVVLGQSLFSNSTNDSYSVANPTKNLNFNIFDGNCYGSQYTLLGATGTGGNVLARMADHLITSEGVPGVVLVPATVGGSHIGLWSNPQTPPYLYNLIGVVARRLAAANLSPTEIIWEHGETDCSLGTAQTAYASGLNTVLAAIQRAWPSTPILVNSAETWINGSTCSSIAAAQAAAINGTSVFAGANTDSLGSLNRWDDTHFNGVGAVAAAALIAAPVYAH
jgi:hypothetical protein